MNMSIFLTSDEIRELTGISRGKAGKAREQLQAASLRTMKIPFYLNAVGRPIVARAVIEGVATSAQVSPKKWEPAL